MFSADFPHQDPYCRSGDREYSSGDLGYDAGAIDYPDAPFDATWYDFGNTDNISIFGNTIWAPYYKAPSNCEQVVDPDTGERLLAGPYLYFGFAEICGFDYTAAAWETADIKRASTFLHADYELTPNHALRIQSVFSNVNIHGRYAPPPGVFAIPPGAAEGLKEGFNFDIPHPQLLPYNLYHRFVGLGNRNFKARTTLLENAILAYGSVGMFDYELEVRHTRYDGVEDSCCYAKKFTAQQYVAQGLYNPFDPLSPDNADAYDAITANGTRDSRGDLRSYSGNVSFDMFNVPGGPVGWAFGFDYFDELFYDIYDPLSAGGDLIGSAGNSGGGERLNYAGFGEAYIPLIGNLEVSAAMRWDHYDDSAGQELSSYLSARYQPTDWLLFRASWGEGFRAPNMNNLYAARSFSAEGGTDLVDCDRNGVEPKDCPEFQYSTFSGGNPLLKPLLSDSYNVGFVVDWEPITMRVDYWNVQIEDSIGIATLQGLINSERRGQCEKTGRIENTIETGQPAEIIQCSPGNVLKRDPTSGTLIEAEAGWGNTSEVERSGVDMFLSYDLETATAGDFYFALQGTRVLRARSRSQGADDWSSSLGEGVGDSARPKYGALGVIRWSYTDHTVSAYIRHTAGYVRPDEEFSAPSHTEFDLLYRWATPWDGRITLGVKNLTDEDPELDSFASPRPAVYSLYSLDGRVPYLSYRHYF